MQINEDNKLLTIAIPTYNRAQYLDLCLDQICKQLKRHSDNVELIVSNNNSTDITEEIVYKYLNKGFNIRYIKNEVNIGGDRNILQCFNEASGKYVLVFGDDDILVEGALDKIISVLKDGEYGVVYITPYSFTTDFRLEKPKKEKKQTKVYNDMKKFIADVNIMFTFVSGNICNKKLVKNLDYDEFINSNLIQLTWLFSAILNSNQNIIVYDNLVASKTNNSGGYKFFTVFGKNFNEIMMRFGLPQESIEEINERLLLSFFPHYIIEQKKNKRSNFQTEDIWQELYPVYKSNIYFRLLITPMIKLPLPFAKIIVKLIRKVNRFNKIRRYLKNSLVNF